MLVEGFEYGAARRAPSEQRKLRTKSSANGNSLWHTLETTCGPIVGFLM